MQVPPLAATRPSLPRWPSATRRPRDLEAAGEVDEHRVAVVRNRRIALARLDLVEDLGERDGAVLEAAVLDVARAEAGDDHERAARPRHRDREQAVAAGPPEGAEVAQHAAVRGAAVADREHHPVAALRHRAVDGQHDERLRAVADHEFVELRMRGHRREDGLQHAHGVLLARGDDHEGVARPRRRVLDDEFDHAVDLGVDALDGTRVGLRHAGAVLDVVEHEAAVTEERSRPGQRVDPAAVEAAVDEFGEVLAAGAIAAGQAQGRQHGAQLREGAAPVQLVERRLLGVRLGDAVGIRSGERPGRAGRRVLLAHRELERRRGLRDRVAERDHLPGPTDGARRSRRSSSRRRR